MQMNDDEAHLGIVDGSLRGAPPSGFGRRIIFVEADHLERVEILKLQRTRILDPAAEHEMELAHAIILLRDAGIAPAMIRV
jgi:hypothetical protein